MTKPSDPMSALRERIIEFLGTQNGQRIAVTTFSLVATSVLVLLPGGALAYVFGVPLMFFIPGFTVVRMFFQQGTSVEARFVLSMGLSLLVVVFLGLALAVTPVGLSADSAIASLTLFTLGAVALETFWLRADRYGPDREPEEKPEPPEKMDKVVAAMLATALVVSGISLGLIVTAEQPSRTFFALTDANGNVITSTTWTVGSNITLLLHTKNGEDGERIFTMSAYGLNSYDFATQTYNRTLEKDEGWNHTVMFNLTLPGYFRLDFDLFIQDGDRPPYLYGNLHIWIRVIEA